MPREDVVCIYGGECVEPIRCIEQGCVERGTAREVRRDAAFRETPRFGARLQERLAAAPADDDSAEVPEPVVAAARLLIRDVEALVKGFRFHMPASVERLRRLLPPEES